MAGVPEVDHPPSGNPSLFFQFFHKLSSAVPSLCLSYTGLCRSTKTLGLIILLYNNILSLPLILQGVSWGHWSARAKRSTWSKGTPASLFHSLNSSTHSFIHFIQSCIQLCFRVYRVREGPKARQGLKEYRWDNLTPNLFSQVLDSLLQRSGNYTSLRNFRLIRQDGLTQCLSFNVYSYSTGIAEISDFFFHLSGHVPPGEVMIHQQVLIKTRLKDFPASEKGTEATGKCPATHHLLC